MPLDSPPSHAIPTTPPRRNQFVAVVCQNHNLCREHYRLSLRVENLPATEPGQFVQVACRDLDDNYSPEKDLPWDATGAPNFRGRELMTPLAMLRRAFSLAGRKDTPGGAEIQIIQRVVGVGTAWLSQLKPGDKVHVLGPLGNRFPMTAENEIAILIAGGVGIGPMLYLASRLRRRAVAFCGAVTRDLLPLTITRNQPNATPNAATLENVEPANEVAEFADYGVPAVLSTDDGSYGFRGYVTQALERYLRKHFPAGAAVPGRPRPVFYTCGPEPMMKRVAELAAEGGWEAHIAVERAMACGMGTCQSCVIRVKRQPGESAGDGKNWAYKLSCTDGPVFSAKDLLW